MMKNNSYAYNSDFLLGKLRDEELVVYSILHYLRIFITIMVLIEWLFMCLEHNSSRFEKIVVSAVISVQLCTSVSRLLF